MTEKQHQQSSITYLSDNNPHRVYLTTYPHLDKEKFPTREKFGKACASAFGRNNVLYFACSREPHKVTNAENYHAIIRLNPSQRWKTEKEFFRENYSIVAKFAFLPNNGMYAGA